MMSKAMISSTSFVKWLEAAGIIPEGVTELTIHAKYGSPVYFSVEYEAFELSELIEGETVKAQSEVMSLTEAYKQEACKQHEGDSCFACCPNSQTLDKDDLIWRNIFGSQTGVNGFLGENRTIRKRLRLTDLWYDPCDHII